MGLIKEPKNVDFTVQSEPWTEEELKDFRKLMSELKAKTVKRKVRSSTKKRKVGAWSVFRIPCLKRNTAHNKEIAEGFLFCLLSSKRLIHEILRPSLLDHKATLISQFSGMAEETFTYDMFESTRLLLIETVVHNINLQARNLIVSFSAGKPEWDD